MSMVPGTSLLDFLKPRRRRGAMEALGGEPPSGSPFDFNALASNPLLRMGLNLMAQPEVTDTPVGFGQALGTAGLQTMEDVQRQRAIEQERQFRREELEGVKQEREERGTARREAQAAKVASQEAEAKRQSVLASFPMEQSALDRWLNEAVAAGVKPSDIKSIVDVRWPKKKEEKAPLGMRFTKEGNLEPIPGYLEMYARKQSMRKPSTVVNVGQEKPLTEGQAATAGFVYQASNANDAIESMEAAGYRPGYKKVIKEKAGKFLGYDHAFLNETDRLYEQSMMDFITAVLRKKSGATITPEEYKIEERKYVPQPGDSDRVVAQKALSRKREIEALNYGTGPAFSEERKPRPAVPKSQAQPTEPQKGKTKSLTEHYRDADS